MQYDKIIIGAGLYGLYSALYCGKKEEKILVLECDSEPFKRATYINQARVHMGYHYPRSLSTALKSAGYFEKFCKDFGFCIHDSFDQIYATSTNFSWTNKNEFIKFCKDANIKCESLDVNRYFKDDQCDGAYLTKEYTYDAQLLKEHLLKEIKKYKNIEIKYSVNITGIKKLKKEYIIETDAGKYKSDFILNATYASVNQIHKLAGFEPFKIKYELCEIILCRVNDEFKNIGLTVMDGPFFSIMPFGKTGYHSLTAVTFTPHKTSYDEVPTFDCQKDSKGFCCPNKLGNCNDCPARPKSAWPYMSSLARKYMNDNFKFEYVKSLYSMKPILKASEIDDSRPTVIKVMSKKPTFVSVLSGKINTVYDIEEILDNGNK